MSSFWSQKIQNYPKVGPRKAKKLLKEWKTLQQPQYWLQAVLVSYYLRRFWKRAMLRKTLKFWWSGLRPVRPGVVALRILDYNIFLNRISKFFFLPYFYVVQTNTEKVIIFSHLFQNKQNIRFPDTVVLFFSSDWKLLRTLVRERHWVI